MKSIFHFLRLAFFIRIFAQNIFSFFFHIDMAASPMIESLAPIRILVKSWIILFVEIDRVIQLIIHGQN